ncbi:uncharacterized protein N7459_004920 [Penicillium hispanicum]|uniref:uncharacterized protein n=1 Tax=Penicillium hispanicum TaxID=1080232 RepID=UPI0025409636|nr:uncharacterized protein N7459_004920 [Penicillium hispanicum]KAJ5585120.1 hypothetical protein N7459_004920 [Penicillium hispanicum]
MEHLGIILPATTENSKMATQKKAQPVIYSSTYTTTAPPESFSDSAHGDVTWHTLFSQPDTPTSSLVAGIASCPARTGHLCAHRHEQAEIYHIIDGVGEVTIDGDVTRLEKGATMYIPSNAEHGIVNTGSGELRWLYVFATSAFTDVVYRFTGIEKAKL